MRSHITSCHSDLESNCSGRITASGANLESSFSIFFSCHLCSCCKFCVSFVRYCSIPRAAKARTVSRSTPVKLGIKMHLTGDDSKRASSDHGLVRVRLWMLWTSSDSEGWVYMSRSCLIRGKMWRKVVNLKKPSNSLSFDIDTSTTLLTFSVDYIREQLHYIFPKVEGQGERGILIIALLQTSAIRHDLIHQCATLAHCSSGDSAATGLRRSTGIYLSSISWMLAPWASPLPSKWSSHGQAESEHDFVTWIHTQRLKEKQNMRESSLQTKVCRWARLAIRLAATSHEYKVSYGYVTSASSIRNLDEDSDDKWSNCNDMWWVPSKTSSFILRLYNVFAFVNLKSCGLA